VHAGELWFDRTSVGAAIARILAGKATAPAAATLTAREIDIVRFVGEGLRNNAIARQLSLSEKTVRNQLTTATFACASGQMSLESGPIFLSRTGQLPLLPLRSAAPHSASSHHI
jgi:DNA-binding CsgD family transcriptional regulator